MSEADGTEAAAAAPPCAQTQTQTTPDKTDHTEASDPGTPRHAPQESSEPQHSTEEQMKKIEKMAIRVYDESSNNQYKTVCATPATTVAEVKGKYLAKLGIPIKNANLYVLWAYLGTPEGTRLDDVDNLFECFSHLKVTPDSSVIIRCLQKEQGQNPPPDAAQLAEGQPKTLLSSIGTVASEPGKLTGNESDGTGEMSNAGCMELVIHFAGFTSPTPPATIIVNMWATAQDVVTTLVKRLSLPLEYEEMYGLYTVALGSTSETFVPNEELLLGVERGDKFIFKKKGHKNAE